MTLRSRPQGDGCIGSARVWEDDTASWGATPCCRTCKNKLEPTVYTIIVMPKRFNERTPKRVILEKELKTLTNKYNLQAANPTHRGHSVLHSTALKSVEQCVYYKDNHTSQPPLFCKRTQQHHKCCAVTASPSEHRKEI